MEDTGRLIQRALDGDKPELLEQLDLIFGTEMTVEATKAKANKCLRYLLDKGISMSPFCYQRAIENNDLVFLREHIDSFPRGLLVKAYTEDKPDFFRILLTRASTIEIKRFLKVNENDSFKRFKLTDYLAEVCHLRPKSVKGKHLINRSDLLAERRLTKKALNKAILANICLPLRNICFRHCPLVAKVDDQFIETVRHYSKLVNFRTNAWKPSKCQRTIRIPRANKVRLVNLLSSTSKL